MFKTLYNYFKNKRLLLAIILLAVFSISVYTALKIDTVEDISKMIPADDELERFNFASNHIKVNDQIIVNIYTKSGESDQELLISVADSLEENLIKQSSEHISKIRNKVSENLMNDVYGIFYEHLPLFLEEEDYIHIDSLLTEESIDKTLEADLKSLLSPSGMVTKNFIKKDPLSLTPIVLKKLNKLRLDDSYEIFNDHIFTKDKKNVLMFVTSNYSNDETGKNELLVKSINEQINLIQEKHPNIALEIFGAPVISVGNAERIKTDIILTVSIALIALFLFLSFFYKRLEVFFVIFLPAAFGAAVSIAVIKLIQGEVSAISLGVGSILVGISIDYSLHIFTHFRTKSKVSQVFNDVAVPILLSSVTTASAFFCLLFVSSDALKDLGLFAGISVLAAAVFALIALPHFLRKRKDQDGTVKKEFTGIEKFTAYKFHKNKYLVGILLLITTASFFLFNKAEFESNMDQMNYMSKELKQAEKHLDEISNDALRKMFIVSTGTNIDQALRNNEKLKTQIDKLVEEGIIKNYSLVSYYTLSDSLQQIRNKRWNNYWTPERVSTLKNNLIEYGKNYGFKEDAFANFYKLLDQKQFSLSKEASDKLISIFGNELISQEEGFTGIVTLLRLKQEDKEIVYKSIPESSHLFIVDKKHITDKIVLILKRDFNLLVKISIAVVFLILLLYFGRIELTLITIVPMLVSWLWTLSIMWVFGFKFTIFNIIISTFIFGLGIDYSLFITRGLLQKYRYGINNLPSYKTSVLLSAITTITAIGVLIFAKHPAMRSIAFLSVIGILSVVFVTYTLQPILFNFLIRQQGKKRSLPVTSKDLFFGISIFLIFLIGSILSILLRGILLIVPIKKNSKKMFFHHWLSLMYKGIVYIPFNVKKIVNNPYKEDFKKPAIIIANHQAHIDIPLLLMLHPKILILTNDWVQKNIFYGKIVQFADYFPTSNGFEKNLELLKDKIKKGYSVLIYPEGSRSKDLEIKRFHKGAFSYANALNLDILPIIIQGAGDCIPSGEPFLKSGQITVNILKRIKPNDYGISEREQAKNVKRFMKDEYLSIRKTYETPSYFRNRLIANYIYKTPVLEHYTRIKTRIEKNYEQFNKLIPDSCKITDIGCGYGYLTHMLGYCSKERELLGIDYDCQKIETANHTIAKPANTRFICADILSCELPKSDVFILNDVLHYFPIKEQDILLKKCMKQINSGGQIIIRDGNFEMEKKHKGTKISEFFSTKLIKFNKTNYSKLYFTSQSHITSLIPEKEFAVEIIDETKYTSNIVYVIKKL